jgi:hypothetical protein
MTKQQVTTALARARQRAESDSAFRAQVLAQDPSTQAAGQLSAAEWHRLVDAVTELEAQRRADPLTATEVDDGAADAAGVKD